MGNSSCSSTAIALAPGSAFWASPLGAIWPRWWPQRPTRRDQPFRCWSTPRRMWKLEEKFRAGRFEENHVFIISLLSPITAYRHALSHRRSPWSCSPWEVLPPKSTGPSNRFRKIDQSCILYHPTGSMYGIYANIYHHKRLKWQCLNLMSWSTEATPMFPSPSLGCPLDSYGQGHRVSL
jgi:hypothetical protein